MASLYVLDPAAGPVRDGQKLVVPRFGKGLAGVALPSICVKCGSPATQSVCKMFYWHSPRVYLHLLTLPPVSYIIASRMVRKGIELNVPYCQAHALHRKTALPAVGLTFVACFIMTRFVGLSDGVAGIIERDLLKLIILASAIIVWIFWNPLHPKEIDDTCGVFTGCGEEFLRELPAYKPAAPTFQTPPTQRPALHASD
jgi:hypothetical protein